MKNYKKILFTILFLKSIASFSQTIDYAYKPLDASSCNTFANEMTVDGFVHRTSIGRPKYDDNSIKLECKNNNSTSFFTTQYSINYNFKVGYNYKISVNYIGAKDASDGFYPSVGLKISTTDGGVSSGTDCISAPSVSVSNLSGFVQGASGSSYGWANNLIDMTITQSANYLIVGAFPYASTTKTGFIWVRKIQIVETPPAVSFNITPASVPITCGSTTPVTFNINNGGGTTGITNYTWNLGTTPNGWLLSNGTAAPATYSTGLTNTLALTPVCGSVQKNISATVTANATNYNTNTSTVSVTAPVMSIDNNNSICTSQNYVITGFPSCNATVAWSVSPTGIVTPNTSTITNPTFTRVTDGNITLTATVTACGTVQPALTKAIRVGAFTSADYPITGPSSTTCGTLVTYSVPQLSNSPTYVWGFPSSPWQYQGGQGTRILQMRAPTSTSGGVFSLRVDNACGTGSYATKTTTVRCSFALIDLFQVSPNPATNEVTVTANSISTTSFTELKIYNQQGVLKKTQKFAKVKKVTINVSSLPTGIYFIEIVDGTYKERQQLIIAK